MITLKNKFRQLILAVLTCVFFLSCQKDLDYVTTDFQFPDFTTKVTSSVSGFVTDENNAAVLGANISVGGTTTTTDKYGFFEVKNVQVVKNAAVVTVTNPGYFKGIKTWAAATGKSAFFRIKLIPKINVGSISAAGGGNVTLTNGLVISLPANAVVNAATNAAYTGSINVAAFWINPAADDLDRIMPGDLRGIDDSGSLKGLTTYGMAAVELTGASGELLQIATGKKATLTIPLPSAALATAPSSIPLWYFDEGMGLWKQDGSAAKNGNSYVGEVSHFSYWNCDLPNAIVPVTFTVVDASGNPVNNVFVNIAPPNPNPVWAHVQGYTDPSGYVSVFVTPNTQYTLTIFNYNSSCGNYTQNFSVGTTAVNLGNIVIGTGNIATIAGTVTNCSNTPVTNGYIIMQDGYQYYRETLDNTGAFNFVYFNCAAANINFIAEDLTTLQQSTAVTYPIVPGMNTIGNIQACGISTQQFLTYTINTGSQVSFTYPADSIQHNGWGQNILAYIQAYTNSSGNNAFLSFDNAGITTGSMQPLRSFKCFSITDSLTIPNPVNINITEYGATGEFISGNFSGVLTAYLPPNTPYNISCSFRVRRNF
ncbi:MAG: hypothetical protein ABI741_09650 [Ferruginibacter sp.]